MNTSELNYFKLARDRARKELQIALQKRQTFDKQLNELNVRIEELRKGLEGLDALCGDPESSQTDLMVELSDLTLADAVRKLLSVTELHLTPLDIVYRLQKLGYNVKTYTNPLASIHTTLKRLEESGQADTIKKEGKTAYRLLKTEV